MIDGAQILELYDGLAGDLLASLARRSGDPQLATDLLAQTFVIAFEQRRKCKATSYGQRAAWIYRIAANELADHYRHQSREARAVGRLTASELRELSAAETAEIEKASRWSGQDGLLDRALEDLSPDQRQAIVLHVIEERSYPEMSTMLGVSQPAVRARVSRGLRTLRRAIGAELEEKL